jgi:hypothetical protein
MSGFKISTGKDLDAVFETRGASDPSAQYIGYTTSDGKSLSERYLPYTPGNTKAIDTGYKVVDASGNSLDLNNYYNKIPEWSTLGFPQLGALASIRAMHYNQGDLYVGGGTGVGLMRYRNGTWTQVFDISYVSSIPFDHMIWSIHSDGGNDLYVGGNFGAFVGFTGTYNRIIRYDITANTINYLGTSASTTTSNGTNVIVRAIYALDASRVYVCGQFNQVMGTTCYYCAIYNRNTNTWNTGTPASTIASNAGEIYTIGYSAGNIYVAGSQSKIIRLNTSTNVVTAFPAVGAANDFRIWSISVVDTSNIYTAGYGGFFKWNGTSMVTMFTNTESGLFVYAYDASNVFLASGATTKYLQKYDGQNVTTYKGGANQLVNSILATGKNAVYIGGNFGAVDPSGVNLSARSFAFYG